MRLLKTKGRRSILFSKSESMSELFASKYSRSGIIAALQHKFSFS